MRAHPGSGELNEQPALGDPEAQDGHGGARAIRVGGSEVRVGTCSWTDPTLVKQTDWYPRRSMSAAERLGYYAGRFPLVEVDSSYYAPVPAETALAWAERAPEGFCFDVKAYGLLTGHPVNRATLWPDIREALDPEAEGKERVYAHHLGQDALEEVWARFVHVLGPLRGAGRMGCVLLQYPRWFTTKRANRQELERLPEAGWPPRMRRAAFAQLAGLRRA